MDNAQVEAVARAIARANYPGGSDADIDDMWDSWVDDATAAIAAIGPSEYERGFQAAKEGAGEVCDRYIIQEPTNDCDSVRNATASLIATAISNMEPGK